MKKILISLIAMTLLAVIAVVISIKTIDMEGVYQEFAKTSRIDIEDLKKSKIVIKKFPLPYVSIDKVTQENKFFLKDIEIKFSLWSLLQMSPKVSSIKVQEVIVFLDDSKIGALSHNKLVRQLIERGSFYLTANVAELKFVDKNMETVAEIDNVTYRGRENYSEFLGGDESSINFHAKFAREGGGDLINVTLYVNDNDYQFNLSETYKNTDFQSGTVALKVRNLLDNIANLIPEYSSGNKKITSGEWVSIKSNLKLADNFCILDDIKINSDSIEGNGSISISQNNLDTSNIKLNFEKINFQNFFANEYTQNNTVKKKFNSNSQFRFDENPMKISVNIKEANMKENVSVLGMNIKLNIEDGKLNIQDFSADINNGGKFKLDGVVSQNSFRSLFLGKVSLAHTDLNDLVQMVMGTEYESTKPIAFALVSDLKFSSVDVSFKNLLINTNDSQISGNISSKFIGNSPRTSANIRVSKIDLDDESMPYASGVIKYIQDLTLGMKEKDYVKKFIPIRKINAIGNYELSFDKIILDKNHYDDVNFSLSIEPGAVSVEQLYLEMDKDWVDTSFSLQAKGLKPELNFIIHNGSLKSDLLSAPALLDFRDNLKNDYDFSKVDIKMNFWLNNLYSDYINLKKVKFDAHNKKNMINITKFNAGIFGGALKSSGSAIIEPLNINFVYALNSAKFKEIARLMPKGTVREEGVISINGNWSTKGKNLNELAYNLYSQSDFIIKDIFIRNFSIDNLVRKVRDTEYDIDILEDDTNDALLTGITRVRELKGGFELSKGIFSAPYMVAKTDYTAALIAASYNIYDFNINSNADFSFFLSSSKSRGKKYGNESIKINVTTKGNFFNPKKEANIDILKQRIIDRYKEL